MLIKIEIQNKYKYYKLIRGYPEKTNKVCCPLRIGRLYVTKANYIVVHDRGKATKNG